MVYGPKGRLIRTTAGGTTTEFLYDGDALIAEYVGGTVINRYAHGGGVDDPIVWYEGAGTATKNYITTDERGSIIGLTSSTGANTRINAYDEWGVPEASNLGRFQYTGQIWLDEIGKYYYKARIYDPKLGRFLQTDPIGYEDGMNLYAYVANDPVNMVDPTGRCGANDPDWPYPCPDEIVVTGPKAIPAPSRNDGGNLPVINQPADGGKKDEPEKNPVQCDSDLTSILGSATAVLDGFALGADVVAVGAAGVAVATAPTVVGGISATGVAAGARLASAGASVISAGIKLSQGDTQGAIASGIGALVGGGASVGSRIAVQIGARTSRGTADVIGEGAGLVASNGTEAAVCGVR